MKSRKNFRKPVTCLFIAFLAATLLPLMTSCKKKEEKPKEEVARPVKMMIVGAGMAGGATKYPGTVRAAQRVDLAFQVSGPLIELPVEESQDMKKGQLIARILPRDFETELSKTKAKSLEAEQQYNRYRELYIKKQVSKADFDKYKAQYDIAKAREKEARDALKDTYLRAPFTGVIAKRYVDNYKDVRAKEPIVSLQDISQIEILLDLPESVMVTLGKRKRTDTVAFAEFAAAPGKLYPATLKEYKTEADPQTQTYQVTLLMPQPKNLNVLPGMTANIIRKSAIEKDDQEKESGPVVIPAAAVFPDETGVPHVWVIDRTTMTVTRRKVRAGDLTGADSMQITEGLQSGETIAVTGVTQLREGMKVSDLSQLEGYGK